jgi:hypothetical protein
MCLFSFLRMFFKTVQKKTLHFFKVNVFCPWQLFCCKHLRRSVEHVVFQLTDCVYIEICIERNWFSLVPNVIVKASYLRTSICKLKGILISITLCSTHPAWGLFKFSLPISRACNSNQFLHLYTYMCDIFADKVMLLVNLKLYFFVLYFFRNQILTYSKSPSFKERST